MISNDSNLEYLAICPASADLDDIAYPDGYQTIRPYWRLAPSTVSTLPLRSFLGSLALSFPASRFSGLHNNCVLSILSLLDAPPLETLLLHNLDLRLLTITQTIHMVAPFENLDTLALLDCYSLRTGEVGIILYELACYATHIIISSSSESDLSLISGNSNLLDSDKHQWPRLEYITLDLSTLDVLISIIKIFERQPYLLTACIVEPLLEHWREVQLDTLMRVEKICKLEGMKVGELMMDEYWPAPGGIFREEESLDHEKG